MKYISFWLILILIASGLQLLGRNSSLAKQTEKIAPASVSKIDGADRMRLTLLPEAAKRLDIQTALVREESMDPKQLVGGQVVSVSTDLNTAIVRVELTENEVSRVRRDEPAFVLPLARDSKAPRIKALPLSGAVANTLSLDSRARRIKALPLKRPTESGLYAVPGTIHYEVSSADHGLVNRQLVFVELALSGEGEKRKVIPYAAVLYDAKGNTWVYTNPEPLVFIRQPIQIDTIVGDEARLIDGPSVGTAVVTVGGAELYGTEFGVGK
jgi:hypothetical protein